MTDDELLALAKKAQKIVPGAWERDSIETDGHYGSGPDVSEGFDEFGIYADGDLLFDSTNTDRAEIEVEYDDDTKQAWNEISRIIFDYIAAANPAAIIDLIERNRAERAEWDAHAGMWKATLDEQRAEIERLHAEVERLTRERDEARTHWRCFHCGECFTDRALAAAHFGVQIDDVADEPACKLNEAEGGLAALLREAQAELRRYHKGDDHTEAALAAAQEWRKVLEELARRVAPEDGPHPAPRET